MLTQLCPVTYANVKSNDSEMNNLSFKVSYFTLTNIFLSHLHERILNTFQFSFYDLFKHYEILGHMTRDIERCHSFFGRHDLRVTRP